MLRLFSAPIGAPHGRSRAIVRQAQPLQTGAQLATNEYEYLGCLIFEAQIRHLAKAVNLCTAVKDFADHHIPVTEIDLLSVLQASHSPSSSALHTATFKV